MRHWTLDEASAELVTVRPIVARVRELVPVVRNHPSGRDPARNGVSSNGHGPPGGTDAEATLRALLTELDERGIIVRDPERGLIDFPALRDGEEIYLCWLLEEDEIAFWHVPEAGFTGRQPL